MILKDAEAVRDVSDGVRWCFLKALGRAEKVKGKYVGKNGEQISNHL